MSPEPTRRRWLVPTLRALQHAPQGLTLREIVAACGAQPWPHNEYHAVMATLRVLGQHGLIAQQRSYGPYFITEEGAAYTRRVAQDATRPSPCDALMTAACEDRVPPPECPRPRGRITALAITLSLDERAQLEAWQRSMTISAKLALRGRIILLFAAGHTITAVAQRVGWSRRAVYRWVPRFLAEGVAGLKTRPIPGRRRGATIQRQEKGEQ